MIQLLFRIQELTGPVVLRAIEVRAGLFWLSVVLLTAVWIVVLTADRRGPQIWRGK